MDTAFVSFLPFIEEKCSIPKNNTSIPEMCHYLKSNCNDIRHFYLKYYYCTNLNNKILSNVLLWLFVIISIGMLFLVLGLLASDYLVPNLSALSETLRMDEKLSGLTLLAFANGSPDILSTFIAMKSNMTTLAIGELLGSANFALTVVIGVLAIYKPFKVNQNTFIRDLLIFSSLFLYCLFILSDGNINLKDSIILCLLYIVFIVLNLFLPQGEIQEFKSDDSIVINTDINEENHSTNDNQSVNSFVSNSSGASNNDYYFAQNIDNLERGRSYKIALIDSLKLAWLWQKRVSSKAHIPTNIRDIEQLSSINETTSLTLPQNSDIENNDFNSTNAINNNNNMTNNNPIGFRSYTNNVITNLNHLKENDSSKDDFQILYPSKHSERNETQSTNSNILFPNEQLDDSFPRNSTPVISIEACDSNNVNNNKLLPLPQQQQHQQSEHLVDQLLAPPNAYHPNPITPSPLLRQLSSTSSLIPYVEYQKTGNMFVKICPIHIITGSESLSEKLLAILLLPISTLFNLIIPIPLPNELEGDILKHELKLSVKLHYLQIFLLPLLLFDFKISTILITISLSLPIVSFLIQYFFNDFFNLIYPILSSIVGFSSVLKLISITASAIISILKELAEIYSLSESILGLTILSLGNSVGDVVTNLALAGLGRPLTGLHACFGSPLLYLLFGIGSCSLIIQLLINEQAKSIHFEVDQSLKLTALSIIFMLLLYSIVIPLNNWMFKRWMGYIGVILWFSITIFNFISHRFK